MLYSLSRGLQYKLRSARCFQMVGVRLGYRRKERQRGQCVGCVVDEIETVDNDVQVIVRLLTPIEMQKQSACHNPKRCVKRTKAEPRDVCFARYHKVIENQDESNAEKVKHVIFD